MDDYDPTKDISRILGISYEEFERRELEEIVRSVSEGFRKRLADIMSRQASTAAGVIRRRFRHKKTGGVYSFIAEVVIEATLDPAVAYQGNDGTIWVRPRDEFFDGRFEEIVDG